MHDFLSCRVKIIISLSLQAIDEVTDMEVCTVATEARATLLRAVGTNNKDRKAASKQANIAPVFSMAEQALKQSLHAIVPPSILATPCGTTTIICEFITKMVLHAVQFYTPLVETATSVESGIEHWRYVVANIPMVTWNDCSVPYLKSLMANSSGQDSIVDQSLAAVKPSDQDADDEDPVIIDDATTEANMSTVPEELARLFRKMSLGGVPDAQDNSCDDDSNLCNIKFSLAFGGKTLLYNTRLRLGRGRRYGVMGKNGTGKTTLLTNIASGNIEGLPVALRTVYVQHDDPTDDQGRRINYFICK